MSVETKSRDKQLIRLAAVERALPSFLRRGRFSLMHGDNAVGEAVKLLPIDQARLPNDAKMRVMVSEVASKYGGLPTAIIPITQAIADVFPKLRKFIGKPAAFAGGTIWDDDRIGKVTREEILRNNIDSFSIAGASFKTRPITWCDDSGCEQVNEVADLDLSMLTLCTSNGQKTQFGQAQAQNPGASFVVIQQAFCTKCEMNPCTCNCDCATVSTMHLKDCPKFGEPLAEGLTSRVGAGVSQKLTKGLVQAEGKPLDEAFDPRKHPRDEDGRWGPSGREPSLRHPVPDAVNRRDESGFSSHGREPGPRWKVRQSKESLQQAEATSHVSLHWQGLPFIIENGKGTIRRGVGPNGPWERVMLANYGYIQRTEGTDGDEIDCYIGDNLASEFVLVINQLKRDGTLDEQKVVLGCSNAGEALALYKAHYPPEHKCGSSVEMTLGFFKDWLKAGAIVKTESTITEDQLRTFAQQADAMAGIARISQAANSTTDGIKGTSIDGEVGEPMTTSPAPNVQTASGSASVQTVVVTPEPVKQALPVEVHNAGETPLLLELSRRTEHLEQELALLKGQRTENPIKEDQPMPDTNKMEEPKKDEMPDDKKKDDEMKAAYQADIKQAVDSALKQALDALPALVASAVKQALPAPPEPVKQAKVVTIETPAPAAASPSDKNDPEIERLTQALDQRGPVGFREVLTYARKNNKE